MKTGCLVAVIAMVLTMVVAPFLAPMFLHGASGTEMQNAGARFVPFALAFIALPGFVIGYLVEKRKRGS